MDTDAPTAMPIEPPLPATVCAGTSPSAHPCAPPVLDQSTRPDALADERPAEQAILTLNQWLSPAYPIGAFTYSHGLEAAADQGWINSAEDLHPWLLDLLHKGSGRNEALLLAAAYQAKDAAQLQEVETLARALSPSRERLLETEAMGAAFVKTTAAIWGGSDQPLSYPVALGQAAAREALPQRLTATLYLQAFVSNLIACAQRLLPLGQTAAQDMLHQLSADCLTLAQETAHGDLSQIYSCGFLSDIASMKHETQYSRIFRT